MFKKLGNKIQSYVGDLVGKSQHDLQFSAVSNGGGVGGEGYDSKFAEIPVEDWDVRQISGWVHHIFPFGKASAFLGVLWPDDEEDDVSIFKLKYHKWMEIMDMFCRKISFSKSFNIIRWIVELGYLQTLAETDGAFYNRRFGFVLKKLSTHWCPPEFIRLQRGIRVHSKENVRISTEMGEVIIRKCVDSLIVYVNNLLDEKRLVKPIRDHLYSKVQDNADDDDLIEFHTKIILIDQINESDPNTTNEDIMLQKKTKRFFSPIVNKIPFLKPEFGIYHVGLELDYKKLYVEWTTVSTAFYKELETTSPVLTVKLETVHVKKCDIDEFSAAIAKTLLKDYSLIHNNCQHFVVDVCKTIGVAVEIPKGAFKTFFDNMKKKGKSEIVFNPGEAFQQEYEVEREREFKTHRDLDLYCLDIMKKCKDKKKLEKTSEWKLLESFDQVFWIKYFSEKNLEKGLETISCKETFQGELKVEDMICPFFDQKDIESEIYQKVKDTVASWNEKYQRSWYQSYLDQGKENLSQSFRCSFGEGGDSDSDFVLEEKE